MTCPSHPAKNTLMSHTYLHFLLIQLLQSAVLYLIEAYYDSKGVQNQVLLYSIAIFCQSCPPDVVSSPEIIQKLLQTVGDVWSKIQSSKVCICCKDSMYRSTIMHQVQVSAEIINDRFLNANY